MTRILPAVSDPDAARALATLLGQLPDSEPVPAAADSTQLLDTLERFTGEAAAVGDLPEVVVVHELIGPLPALELIREVALRFPAVGVVLATQDTTPGLYSAAMDAGARGVVALPLAYEELAARVGAAATWAVGVRRHLGQHPGGDTGGLAGPAGTVLAVTGAKGGVGCTLAAVQLALAARASGRGAALVDMNLQSGDVASFLDVQFRRSVVDLAGISDLTSSVLADAVFNHESGLALLLAPAEGERGEEVDDRAARQIVHALRSRYEVVVIDCGTQMHTANAAAVEMADQALLLTTPDVVSVRAAKRMLRLWERLQVRKAEETVTVINRASRHAEIQPSLVARITGTPVARATVPAHFKELHSALDAGRLQDLDQRSTIKAALGSLAAELGIAAPPQPAGRGGGKPPKGARAAKWTKDRGPRAVTGAAPDHPAVPEQPGHAGHLAPPGKPAALPPGPPDDDGGGAGAYGADTWSGDVGPDDTGAVRAWGRGLRDDRGAVRLPGRVGGRSGEKGERGRAGSGDGRTGRGDGRTGGSGRGDRGALTVEFAGMLPIVLVVLALLWQCVLIGYTFTLAGNAADEGARAATAAEAHGDPAAACQSAAREHLPSAWASNATISCHLSGNLWKAEVDLATPVLFPGAAHLPFTVNGSAGAAREVGE